MNTLAHVLEAAGLATIALPAMLPVTRRMRPPRALYCEFPLGRPLGRPSDPAFQRRVLTSAFDLLRRPSGPVLETFPETVGGVAAKTLACPVPPRFDPNVRPVIAEARALRPAYDRAVARHAGRTQVGRVLDPDRVPEALGRFDRLAQGESWSAVGFASESELIHSAMDVRAYYEEAAIGLSEHVPAARSAESWLYGHTEAGKVFHAVVARLLANPDPSLAPTVPLVLLPYSQREVP